MHHECKRCLLFESGERVTYDEIMAYIKTVDSNEKVSEQEYEERIKHCKECDYLISGMCRKCGCYVEIRARMKNTVCPNYDDRKW
jgi:predicted Zn-ribbon and HTH transcriptional regulator